ncbi:MAG TPA: sulfatase-like hydrolase/transferase [Verrucomicrobiae bacterium]
MFQHFFKRCSISAIFLTVAQFLLLAPTATQAQSTNHPPNILFIIMDDVGIDQLKSFNPTAPQATPVMDTLVQHGVSFNNCWMMPECSPSRACFFTGRFPVRTGVRAALLDYDLPSSQVSPYEMTTPRVLTNAGYASALIGKYHLGGPDHNPAGIGAPEAIGWNYFVGCLVGGPPYIDSTLGGQTTNTELYPSGFPVGSALGAGWFMGPQTNIYCDDNGGAGYTGRECLSLGGIPALNANGGFAATVADATITPTFTNYNAYYAWPKTVNIGTNINLTMDRRYMVTAQTDDALQWIHQQNSNNVPWMCTVSYSSIHTPYQEPPTNLYPAGFVWPTNIVPEGNTTEAQIKIVSNLMLYALDKEIGRLLVSAGLATNSPTGDLVYTPETTDTMIIVCGDNGTYFSSVNLPYNPLRAKASPYQTGIEAPIIVSGPMVVQPGRTVTNMVNAVDLFSLFGEIAGLNVRSVVPASHILDCVPMMPYLTNPVAPSARQYNFTQLGSTVPPGLHIWPAVLTIAGQKVGTDTLFDSQSLAEDEGAEWFGPGAPTAYNDCCEVRANVYTNLTILPYSVWAVCNDRYKLVKSDRASCDADINPYEFYDLTRTLNNPVGLDNSPDDLLAGGPLTKDQQSNLDQLMAVLEGILASEPNCPGDGTLDKTVNVNDINGVTANWGQSSVFDFNNDGVTDQNDMQIVLNNYNDQCFQPVAGAVPLNINPAGSLVQIQWPNTTTPGQLEFSSQLSGTNGWNLVGNAPFAIGYSNAVFLSPTNQAMFFRVQP